MYSKQAQSFDSIINLMMPLKDGRTVSHISYLESVTYNPSMDYMRYVKQHYEGIIAACDSNETSVISGAHDALGDICAIEQSYADAIIHYNIACGMLLNLLDKDDPSVHHDTLLNCIEVLLKQGDLEEHKQNLNNAAAIYFEADRIVKKMCDKDEKLKENLKNGNSNWILLKQPFWAYRFLSLKRSSYSFDANFERKAKIHRPEYLYSEDDQNFYNASASLYFFEGNVDLAKINYEAAIEKIKENKIEHHEYDERVAFLKGNASIGVVESIILSKSRKLFYNIKGGGSRVAYCEMLFKFVKNEINCDAQENNIELKGGGSRVTYCNMLLKFVKNKINCSPQENNIEIILDKAAEDFENNGLYVNAAVTHIKTISYFTAILDAFHCKIFDDYPDPATRACKNKKKSLKVLLMMFLMHSLIKASTQLDVLIKREGLILVITIRIY